MPRHLIIEITSYCNLKCRMCPKTHHAVNTPEDRVMAWDVFQRLVPLFPHIESLDLNGVWGEAFLHPDLYVRMLEVIKSHGTGVYTMSNGTLLTESLARRLVELDLNRLVVSIDAATAETYARIRPPGRFSKIVDGLRAVKAWKARLGRPHPQVDLAFLGMRTNIAELPDVVRLAHAMGAAQVFLQAMGEYPGLENESIAAHDKALGRRIYAQARRLGNELGVAVVLLPGDQFLEDRRERNVLASAATEPRRHRKQCYDLWNRALIAANGDVLPCCSSPRPMGNLTEASFAQIWRGERYNMLRRQFLGGTTPAMCRHCTGTAWVENSKRQDLQFFVSELMAPRLRHRIGQYRAAQWLKLRWDRLQAG
jgi:radical SAM protein with 4Fe4S-binding SPASM domain